MSRLLRFAAPVAFLATPLLAQAPAARPWLNERLSPEARATLLVQQMTLEEKAQQMKDVAPAIPRLGVPAYNWWNEALHGVARSGLATVFPQAIGMAATWNDSLIFRLATVVSDEARAKHHEYLRRDSHARYQGLTFWSPNINIFRDPRWGRGQETFGEDPFLTGRLAVPFIKGLQGNDPKYFKTVATVKHFAVHSGPESDRHTFDAIVSERDLRETYLPQFEMGIKEGGAYSLMCAYNRLAGKAACASDPLLKDILRGEWKFRGFIVSDCGAIDDIFLRHKVAPDAASAAALAVKSGTDLDCGRIYPSLVESVKRGLITEPEIDTSLVRLFVARMRLGMFDDPSHVKYAQTPFEVLDRPAHRTLARDVARQSLVLLKNRGNALPLSPSLRSIAVVGPNANDPRMLLGNYNGEPADPITPLRGIRDAVPNAKVTYARGADLVDGFPVLDSDAREWLTTPTGERGLRVDIYSNRRFEGAPVITRVDSTANVRFLDDAPRAGMNADDFSVRWTGVLRVPTSGTYRLGLLGTMKFRLRLNDSLQLRSTYPQRNDEYPDPRLVQSPPLTLDANVPYRVVIEAEESDGDAQLQLVMSVPPETLERDAVRAAQEADVSVLFLGLTARLEGEEMPVTLAGFAGGDRTRIDLPAVQQRLLERIVATGKPVVLVLMSGSAVAINWANDRVPAILQAWYPGQAGGAAIADVLFGAYNPAGRLPVTFYKSETDLPDFSDYAMKGRTYRFFTGTPLYPFGHGLSYTTFAYSDLRVSRPTLGARDTAVVSVLVKNTGARAGDEVVQLYARHEGSAVDRATRDLRGFRRITLAPGASQRVTFRVPASALRYWDATAHRWTLEADRVVFEAGASSADIRASQRVRVMGGR
jgi:beta-glucosidase